MPEPAMIDLLKVLQYLRKRCDDYQAVADRANNPDGWAAAASNAYADAIDKVEQVLEGHQRTTEKFAHNLQQVLDGR